MNRHWKSLLAALVCAGFISLAGCEDRDNNRTDTYGTPTDVQRDRTQPDATRNRDDQDLQTDTDIDVKQVPEPDGVGTDTDIDVRQVPEGSNDLNQ